MKSELDPSTTSFVLMQGNGIGLLKVIVHLPMDNLRLSVTAVLFAAMPMERIAKARGSSTVDAFCFLTLLFTLQIHFFAICIYKDNLYPSALQSYWLFRYRYQDSLILAE